MAMQDRNVETLTLRPRRAEARVNLRQRRKWYEGEGESGGDAGDTKGGGSAGEKQFTQADLDRIIADRLKRADASAAEKTRADILKELGVEDVKTAAATLKAAREHDEAQKSDLQKALDAKTALEKERDDAKKALADHQTEAQNRERVATRDGAVLKALAAVSAKAEKVLKLLKVDHADALAATLKEDGTVDEKKVAALVEVARKDYAEDFGKPGVGTPSHKGGATPRPQLPKVKTSGKL